MGRYWNYLASFSFVSVPSSFRQYRFSSCGLCRRLCGNDFVLYRLNVGMSDRLALSRAKVAAWDIVIYVTGESILGVFFSVCIRFAGVVGAADTTDEL